MQFRMLWGRLRCASRWRPVTTRCHRSKGRIRWRRLSRARSWRAPLWLQVARTLAILQCQRMEEEGQLIRTKALRAEEEEAQAQDSYMNTFSSNPIRLRKCTLLFKCLHLCRLLLCSTLLRWPTLSTFSTRTCLRTYNWSCSKSKK